MTSYVFWFFSWAATQALPQVPEEGSQEEGEAFPHQPGGGGDYVSVNSDDNDDAGSVHV